MSGLFPHEAPMCRRNRIPIMATSFFLAIAWLVGGCSQGPESAPVADVVPHSVVDVPKTEDRERAFLNSIMFGDEGQFRRLLDDGMDANCVFAGSRGLFSPAAAAIVYRRPSMFETLLRAGASPYSRYQSYSLLELAMHRFGPSSTEVKLVEAAISLKLVETVTQ